jgi:hypothetical protein
MVPGTTRARLLLAAAIPPATRRGDPYRPAEPGSHVYLRHHVYLFRHMLLMRAATRAKPAGQPRRQLQTAILDRSG